MVQQAGSFGIWQILLIAVAVMWLLNAYRRSKILAKMEEEIDKRTTRNSTPPKEPEKKSGNRLYDKDTEDADFEVIE